MDVMCVTSTHARYVEPAGRRGRAHCKLPYSSSPSRVALTLSQTLMDEVSRRRLSEAMLAERERFLERLHREREGAREAERTAAVRLQAIVRGYLCGTSFWGRARSRRQQRRAVSSAVSAHSSREFEGTTKAASRDDALRADLISLAAASGLSIIPGLSLSPQQSKSRRRAERERAEERAASRAAARVQALTRRRQAVAAAEKEKEERQRRAVEAKMTRLQALGRGANVRSKARRAYAEDAAAKIQAHFRVLKTSNATDELRTSRLESRRKSQAATKIAAHVRMRSAQTAATLKLGQHAAATAAAAAAAAATTTPETHEEAVGRVPEEYARNLLL